MNLKLLLTAVLSTIVLAAHADVQLYSSIKSGIETSQAHFGGQTRSSTAIADQGSHIGLRGSYSIGGGTSFIWEVEQDTPVGKSSSIHQDWCEHREDSGRWRKDWVVKIVWKIKITGF